MACLPSIPADAQQFQKVADDTLQQARLQKFRADRWMTCTVIVQTGEEC
jgi:hypothetical protein